MKSFIDKDFMLENETAKHLFFDIAKDLPIYDYHCHLSPAQIYENKPFKSITDLWLGGDHYKWRLMRLCGVDEKYITGDGSEREKFRAYASIMPYIIGNPVYIWTHLELQRFFDIKTPLSSDTADAIYDTVTRKLSDGHLTPQSAIETSGVKVVCTTDDPIDSLEYHIKLKKSDLKAAVLPTFRPDKAINISSDGFVYYINKLCPEVDSIDEVVDALCKKADFFDSVGCRISDHAFKNVPFTECTRDEANRIFIKRMGGGVISKPEADAYRTYLFLKLGKKYHSLGWAMQMHIGALRNTNRAMYDKLGADTGYDSVYASHYADQLGGILNALSCANKLPKTILYTLNPADNYVLATMLGNFAADEKGKMQFGSAWWFCDHYEGMKRHFKELASVGAIGTFVGMLTDSRSFLSYPRHEYFRRIICNIIGEWVESGQFPNDEKALTTIVRSICCDNIVKYLNF